MGNSASRVVGCFGSQAYDDGEGPGVASSGTLDEGLGHSFCYIRPALDSPSLSPSHSLQPAELVDKIGVESELTEYDASHEHHLDDSAPKSRAGPDKSRGLSDRPRSSFEKLKPVSETSFKSISGASVSANTATPRSMLSNEQFTTYSSIHFDRAADFKSTASFSALPLQPVPRSVSISGPLSSGPLSGPLDRGFLSGPLERGFMSGPLERGFLSGPLERGYLSGPLEPVDRSHFSAPLGGRYSGYMRRRRHSLSKFVKAVSKPFKKVIAKTSARLARTQKSFLFGDKRLRDAQDSPPDTGYTSSELETRANDNLQWAQGKAGEDRVHVVLSEEHGWLFVGIYDGFNGPDAPDFLMSNLYPAIYRELKGLLWDQDGFELQNNEEQEHRATGICQNGLYGNGSDMSGSQEECYVAVQEAESGLLGLHAVVDNRDLLSAANTGSEEPGKDGLLLDGKKTVDEQPGQKSLRSQLLMPLEFEDKQLLVEQEGTSKKLQGQGSSTSSSLCPKQVPMGMITTQHPDKRKSIQKKYLQWRYDWEQDKLRGDSNLADGKRENEHTQTCTWSKGVADHSAVLGALARALGATEDAYLDMADQALEENPELALMGSCVLVMLMKDEDVYIMNVGDSRAILAQYPKVEPFDPLLKPSRYHNMAHSNSSKSEDHDRIGARDSLLRLELERIIEETPTELAALEAYDAGKMGPPSSGQLLGALQLSSDHSTSIHEEVLRIRAEHPDDDSSICNDRVKGSLKVTRAFGAGFLKQPKWNSALLEMFRIDFIGTTPYIICTPFLHHHRLGPDDHFLVLSSDGLYQYMSNEEVISHVEWFMEKFPDGDPAQHLIEEVLFRAAKSAGMDFHELLDIPQGDRRKYHDDVSVMVISLEGRIWRSSG